VVRLAAPCSIESTRRPTLQSRGRAPASRVTPLISTLGIAQRPMRSLALAAIEIYQRYLSPYKGFCCAYGFHTGNRSCSALGYRAIRVHGVIPGLALLRLRFERCSEAHRRYGARISTHRGQRGVCDFGCVPCDLPAIDCVPAGSDVLSFCSCSPCDCGTLWKSAGSPRVESRAYVPPQRQRENKSNQGTPPPDA
jgi:putative component of membrane protein insertase Oxa1/YidC/SpoIIIJ protein YidD